MKTAMNTHRQEMMNELRFANKSEWKSTVKALYKEWRTAVLTGTNDADISQRLLRVCCLRASDIVR